MTRNRKDIDSGKARATPSANKTVLVLLAVIYAGVATLCAWNVIVRTQASTKAIEEILTSYNMKNEGALAVDRYSDQHPILGLLFGGPVKKELELPSHDDAAAAVSSEVTHLLKTVRAEASVAAWWSWGLLTLSLAYVMSVIALERSFVARGTLFAMTAVSVVFFVIGVLAPAMVIWTAPSIPMESGKFSFVLQHQVRGIAAIIWELLTTGHWVVGGFLLLFSIVTPLTKATLTFFVTGSHAKELNFKIGDFLHNIGKWSMADVFVAGILLSLFALKAQEATRSVPCLGLYYFIGYCLLSMTTTELLTHSGLVGDEKEKLLKRKLSRGFVTGMVAGAFCLVALSSLYTYEQYTENTKQKVHAESSPDKLNNADLVLPAHKSTQDR